MKVGLSMLLAVSAFAADNGDLARFLVKAKSQGYASDVASRIKKLDDGGQSASYEEGAFRYCDRWYGSQAFSGEEVAHHQGKPVWSMNFYGATVKGAPAEFPKFHKAALRRMPEDLPFRGPAFYQEGELVYVNDIIGTIDRFSGVERVLYRGREIYRLVYHGGRLE